MKGAAALPGTQEEEPQQQQQLVVAVAAVVGAAAVAVGVAEAWDLGWWVPQCELALGRSQSQSRCQRPQMPGCGAPLHPQPSAAVAGEGGGGVAPLL